MYFGSAVDRDARGAVSLNGFLMTIGARVFTRHYDNG